MCRVFEPHETLEGRLDPGEILFGQGGGNMPIIAPQQKEHRHIKGQVALAQIEPRNFILKLYQEKRLPCPNLTRSIKLASSVLKADQMSFPVERLAWNTPPNRSTHLLVVNLSSTEAYGGGPMVLNSEIAFEFLRFLASATANA